MKHIWRASLIIPFLLSLLIANDSLAKDAVTGVLLNEVIYQEEESQVVKASDLSEEEKPLYNPAGKRDPFRSPFMDMKKEGKKKKHPKTPLERYDMSELKLTGIVWGEMGRRAMILAPDGKGYSIGINSLIGKSGGRVVGIGEDKIVIEEEDRDFFGSEKKREVIIKLREEGGE